MISTQTEVEAFLKKWKSACANQLSIVQRAKNRDSLACLGWTFTTAKEKLKTLTVQNYIKGPEPDRDKPGEFWFFGINSTQGDVYVKVKIFECAGKYFAKCVSFHLAEYEIKYPYKK